MFRKRNKKELMACRMLRQAWDRSFLKWEALKREKIAVNQYKCQGCGGVFKLREVQVDHIVPVVEPQVGWVSVADFAARLFCSSGLLQVMCQDNCHRLKTNNENVTRRKVKRESPGGTD